MQPTHKWFRERSKKERERAERKKESVAAQC